MASFLTPLIAPELELDRREHRRVMKAAWKRWMKSSRNRALYALGLVICITGFLFLPDRIEPLLGGHRPIFWLIWLALYVVGLFVLFLVLRTIAFAPCVYAELRVRGHNVCAKCGYLLHGLPEDEPNCPECGAIRTPVDPNNEGADRLEQSR